MITARFQAIVLAGERPQGNPLRLALDLPAGVLAPLAGQTCIERVVQSLRTSRSVAGGILCGPSAPVMEQAPELRELLAPGDFRWLAPADGPAASAVAAAAVIDTAPLLVTTADHGLLQSATIDAFCESALTAAAEARQPDVLVGLVPYPLVQRAFPQSRRTLLRFSDGVFCGSNLFAVMTRPGVAALHFWSAVETHRKSPWKIARQLGAMTLLRYLCRKLPVDQAFQVLSQRAGCTIGWVAVSEPRAAVDIDSLADWKLACALLEREAVAKRTTACADDRAPAGGTTGRS